MMPKKEKRYLIFAWFAYEASGGWNDLVDSVDTLDEDEINELLDCVGWDSAHIVDSETFEIVSWISGESSYNWAYRRQ